MTKCRIISPEYAVEEEPEKICFNGDFTDTVRAVFKAHRLNLGVSLQQLGGFIQINWSTIRKWESGITRRCHSKHVARVNAFLNHEYDARLRLLGQADNTLQTLMERVPVELQACLERAWVVFGVCGCYPGEEERFLKDLGDTLDWTAKRLLGICVIGVESNEASMLLVAEERGGYMTEPSMKDGEK